MLNVVVAIIVKNGKVLLSWRTAFKPQGNLFEFPGGKVEVFETIEQALQRELQEELAIDVTEYSPIKKIVFNYPQQCVCLWVYRVTDYQLLESNHTELSNVQLKSKNTEPLHAPKGAEGQNLFWVNQQHLYKYPLPAANNSLKQLLTLPDYYAITPIMDSPQQLLNLHACNQLTQQRVNELEQCHQSQYWQPINKPTQWHYIRQPNWSIKDYSDFLNQTTLTNIVLPARIYLGLLTAIPLTIAPLTVTPLTIAPSSNPVWSKIVGVHVKHAELYEDELIKQIRNLRDSNLNKSDLNNLSQQFSHQPLMIIAASHDLVSAQYAESLDLFDALTLSPVQATTTHPKAITLGWNAFKMISQQVWLPIYALGGIKKQDLNIAQQYGAYGVSGISNFN